MKKVLATVLALVLALGLCTTSWAETTANCTAEGCEHKAAIGTTHYDTLTAAVEAATNGQTIVLVAGTAEDITVANGKDITIDLNGKTVKNVTSDTITVALGAKLTITGTGTVDNVTHGKAAIYNNGTVILNGGSYTRSAEAENDTTTSGGNSYYNILNHGVMTINAAVEVKSSGHFSSLIANGYYSYTATDPRSGYVDGTNQAAPQLTINGGTFSGGINTVKNDDGASLVINDGHFSNVTQATVQNNNTAEIHGGTFDAAGHDAFQNRYYAGGKNNGVLTITAGQFTGDVYSEEGATTAISGGAFSSDVSAYAGSNAVASLKNVYYVGTDSIEAAVNSMSGGDTLTVIKGSVKVGNTEYGANQTYTKPTSYYYYSPSTTTPDTTKGSPKTFDAGVGIYAVTAVLSMTGMAWTAKKRH